MMNQESLNRLRHGVVPVEIALVDEAIDLRFRDRLTASSGCVFFPLEPISQQSPHIG